MKSNEEKKSKKSYGKEFERQVFKGFSQVDGVSIDRIPDQVTKFKGSSSNICDFLVYKKPTLLYLECKSVHGNTLSISSVPKEDKHGELHGFFGNIRDNQWVGLLEKSKISGVKAGVLCWWVDRDVTKFFPIELLTHLHESGVKSIRFDLESEQVVVIQAEKRRVLFDYDFTSFFEQI